MVYNLVCVTYGSFMVMKMRQAMNAATTQKNPNERSMVRWSLVRPTELDRSRMMKPEPPRMYMKLLANPSMMYWPFTRYCMKATGLEWPCSSVVDPMEGGSTITS